MAASGGGGGGGAAAKAEEEPLKALVLAGRHNERAVPACVKPHSPACLLPLLGAPVLAYCLEGLRRGGVRDAVVLVVTDSQSYAAQIREFVRRHRRDFGGMSVRVATGGARGWLSVGDALRDIDSRESVRPQSDFVVADALSVCSADLEAAVRRHRARRKLDKNWLAACCFRRGGKLDGVAAGKADDVLVGVDVATGQLLRYAEGVSRRDAVPVDASLFAGRGAVDIVTGVTDCAVDVCAPEVLVEFRENFDFDEMRDFVRGKLESGEGELLGNRIFFEELDARGEYATHIRDYASFYQVCRDLLMRWAHPLAPDLNFLSGEMRFTLQRGHVYREPGVRLGRGAAVRRECVLCADVVVADRSCVDRSVLARGVYVARDCLVRDSILFPDVVIERRVAVRGAILCENVRVMEGAQIGRGAVLGPGVSVGENTVVPDGAVLTVMSKLPGEHDSDDGGDDFDDDEDAFLDGDEREIEHAGDADASAILDEQQPHLSKFADENERAGRQPLVGPQRVAARLPLASGAMNPFAQRFEALSARDDALSSSSESDDDDDDYRDDDRDDSFGAGAGAGGWTDSHDLAPELAQHAMVATDQGHLRFLNETRETMQRAVCEEHSQENTALELNSLKLVYDRSSADAVQGIVPVLLDSVAAQLGPHSSQQQALEELARVQSRWGALLNRFTADDAEQRRVIDALQLYARGNEWFSPLFLYTLQSLYQRDIVGEDAILAWTANARAAQDGNGSAQYLKQIEPFVRWLEEADEEEEEEEEEA